MIKYEPVQIQQQEQQKQNSELIHRLKQIIAQQQSRIELLEMDLKKWEKRYKEQFYKQSAQTNKQDSQKIKNNDLTIAKFTKQIVVLQQKYDKKSYKHFQNTSRDLNFKEIIQLIQKLYKQLDISEKTCKENFKKVEQQQKQIQNFKINIQKCLTQYESAMERSQAYQNKLLEQIRRQEMAINKLKR